MPQTELKLASRLLGVSESVTLNLNAMVQSMKARGVDVVNLTAGEPDFNVPEDAKKAVIDSALANKSKYPPVAGIAELRELVAARTNLQQPQVAQSSSPWQASDVVVTNGGKQALFNAFMAMLDPGDEVVLIAPYWLSYPEMIKVAGGVPRIVTAPVNSGFKIGPEQLEAVLGPKVKAVVLNSPSNPTGAVYSRAEYRALGQVLMSHGASSGAWIISDEIYDRIVFGQDDFCSFLKCCPELRDRTVTVNGMSKSFSMTGWRVGWSVAPKAITQAMIALQGQSTSGVNVLAQWASVAALKVPESVFAYQVVSFRERRDIALEILRKAGKIEVAVPDGAFYAFVGIRAYLRSDEDSVGFSERLLKEANVAVVPGTPFGAPDFVRISFATDEHALREGCSRIVRFLTRG